MVSRPCTVVALSSLLVLISICTATSISSTTTTSSSTSFSSSTHQNNRPVIGILAQPTSGNLTAFGDQYIPASYVKFVEMSGARVAPILFNITSEELLETLSYINGVLLPGGGTEWQAMLTGQYSQTLFGIYNYTMQANGKNADYFPLWGTCQGFEQILSIASGNSNLTNEYFYDAENLTLALNFTDEASSSELFGPASASVMKIFSTEEVTLNNHEHGVPPQTFLANPALSSSFNILSTNVDRNGLPFVSSAESKSMPIFAIQFHPEKNIFEWDPYEGINHSPHAVEATSFLANILGEQARNSTHSIPDGMLRDYLIDSQPIFYSEYVEPSFEQVYAWPVPGYAT